MVGQGRGRVGVSSRVGPSVCTCPRAGLWGSGTRFHGQSARQGRPVATRPGKTGSHAGWALGRAGCEWVDRRYFLHMIRGLSEGQGPKAWSHGPVRCRHPGGPWGLGPGSGRAPGDAAASWGCPPTAAPAAASPLSGLGGWPSPASRTSSRPPRQTGASACGTSWARKGMGRRPFSRRHLLGLPGPAAPLMVAPSPPQLQSHGGVKCGKGAPSPELQAEREGTYHREGRWVMESRAMPASFAAWKILPSTSMLTALVHSSRRAYLGLGSRGQVDKAVDPPDTLACPQALTLCGPIPAGAREGAS